MRSVAIALAILGSLVGFAQQAPAELTARWELGQSEATIGDRLDLQLIVEFPEGVALELPEIGPELGSFSVVDGRWNELLPEDPPGRRIWSGRITAFEIGELELPAIDVHVEDPTGGEYEARADPLSVLIASVLEPGESEPEAEPPLADLKPPASLTPTYRAVIWGTAGLFGLLLLSGVVWWAVRKCAGRLTAVPLPDDPFGRVPPHVWIYEELQRLLDRRLAEQGKVPEFFSELSRILKQYLSGRYRVDLMEQTTAEVPEKLQQAGCPADRIDEIVKLLERCDLVKFAKLPGAPDDCRAAVEQAYEIVDGTKPAEIANADRGAA